MSSFFSSKNFVKGVSRLALPEGHPVVTKDNAQGLFRSLLDTIRGTPVASNVPIERQGNKFLHAVQHYQKDTSNKQRDRDKARINRMVTKLTPKPAVPPAQGGATP